MLPAAAPGCLLGWSEVNWEGKQIAPNAPAPTASAASCAMLSSSLGRLTMASRMDCARHWAGPPEPVLVKTKRSYNRFRSTW